MPRNTTRGGTMGDGQSPPGSSLNGAQAIARSNHYEKADHPGTATYIHVAVFSALFLAIASLAGASTIFAIGADNVMLPKKPAEVNDLAIEFGVELPLTIIITACMSPLDHAQAISYRWELAKKGQLDWNHNFRFFRYIHKSFRHGWFMTTVSAVSSMLVYSSTQLVLVRSIDETFDGHHNNNGKADDQVDNHHSWTVNAIALLFLALGLGGSALTTMACIHNVEDRPWSWNTSALWTVKRLRDEKLIVHTEGRCMRSVAEREDESTDPVSPRDQQPPLWKVGTSVKWYVFIPWFTVLVAVAVTLSSIYGDGHRLDDPDCNCPGNGTFVWQWDLTMIDGADYMELDLAGLNNVGLGFLVALLFQIVPQGILVMLFHCLDLLVNLWRDESDWKEADSEKGTNSHAASLRQTIFSSRLILSSKLLHAFSSWIVGQAVLLFGYNEKPGTSRFSDHQPRDMNDLYIHFSSSRLILVTAALASAALFATVLAFWSSKSQQPAAFGHIQTLANLMDMQPAGDKLLFWGDKGVTQGESGDVAHAGTATEWDELVSDHSGVNRLRGLRYA